MELTAEKTINTRVKPWTCGPEPERASLDSGSRLNRLPVRDHTLITLDVIKVVQGRVG